MSLPYEASGLQSLQTKDHAELAQGDGGVEAEVALSTIVGSAKLNGDTNISGQDPTGNDEYNNKTPVQQCQHVYCFGTVRTFSPESPECPPTRCTCYVPRCTCCQMPIRVLQHIKTCDRQDLVDDIEESYVMVDFAATVFELKTVPSDVRKPTDDALSPKEAAEKQGSVDGKGNLSVKRDSLELNKTTTSSDPHRSSRHRRSRSHKEKAITTQRNSQYEGLLKQVRYRASEIAAEMASKYNYDTPLDSPPTEIILELRELAASLIRAGTETEDMASISSELNKLNSQIRRMEDCVVEHRLPDSNARSDGLSYLSRPLELIYLPTSLLDSPIRDEEDQLSAGLEVIFGVWFPDEKWSCSWQEQKLGTITEVAFHYNTSFSWDHIDEGLVVELPHNALSEDLNSFILLSAA
jgi:hypothetical protein